MAGQKIRIRLRAYDHEVIDNSAKKIVETVTRTGAQVASPCRCRLRRTCTASSVRRTSTRTAASTLRCVRTSVLLTSSTHAEDG